MACAHDEQSLDCDNQLLDCAICMDKIVDPCLLPCSHMFCQHCLVRHYEFSSRCTADQREDENEVISCPACRQIWPLPTGIHVNQPPTSATVEHQPNTTGTNESICCPSASTSANVNSILFLSHFLTLVTNNCAGVYDTEC